MKGYIAGYLSKEAQDKITNYRQFAGRIDPNLLKQLQMVQSMYSADDSGESLAYLAKIRNQPRQQQEAAMREQPQHLPRVLNSARQAKPGVNPYKKVGIKARALWGLGSNDLFSGLKKNLTADQLKGTYRMPQKPAGTNQSAAAK